MATNPLRGALLRSLPVLLLLLTLSLSAPRTKSPALTSAGPAAAAATNTPASSPESSTHTPDGPVADRTRELTAQRTAGVTGSRAPPTLVA